MKFKDVKQGQWSELSRYIDTVLVPVMPLQDIHDLTNQEHLDKLEQAAGVVEEKLKGRLLLWPTFTLFGEEAATLKALADNMATKGFKQVCFLGSALPEVSSANVLEIDLNDKELDFGALSAAIVEKWSPFTS